MACEERWWFFEVVYTKSLEDSQARGWTEALERSNNCFFTVRPKLGLVMAMFAALNYYLFI